MSCHVSERDILREWDIIKKGGVILGCADRWALTKTDKNPASVFRVFDLLFIHTKPYENEFSTALSECKAVARCATRKTDAAINRIKNRWGLVRHRPY